MFQIKLSWKYAMGSFSRKEIYDKTKDIRSEITEYSNRALEMGGLTFAAISFLISNVNKILFFNDLLIILSFAFFLFIISFKLDIFSGKRRIMWELQQRLLNYGILSLVISISLFLIIYIKESFLIAISAVIIIFLAHLKEYMNDYNLYKKTFRKK